MDILDAIRTRFSCREYRTDPVPSEMLIQLVDAARMAPSSWDEQPWTFVVVTEISTLQEMAKTIDAGRFLAKAACCIAVFCRSDSRCPVEDGAAATQNILLAAHGLGLGACWVAGDNKPYAEDLSRLLRAPTSLRLVSLVAAGWPNQSPPTERKKKALEEVLRWQHL